MKRILLVLCVALLLCSCNSKSDRKYMNKQTIEAYEKTLDILDDVIAKDMKAQVAERKLKSLAESLEGSDDTFQFLASSEIKMLGINISGMSLRNQIDSGDGSLYTSDIKELQKKRKEIADKIK